MIDPASIRTASFSLTPTGYNPEEVDRFLAELADATPGSIELAELRNASFSLTPTGYNPEEVDQFLGSIADQLADAPAPQPEPFQREEQPVPVYDDERGFEPAADVEPEPVAEVDHEDEPEAEIEDDADEVYQPVAEVEADEQPVAAEHDGWHQSEVAVEPEPEPELVLVESIPDEPAGEPPVASLPEPVVAERPHADLGSLSAAVETAVESLESFVKNELHNLREVSALEIDDILAERQRLIEDATKRRPASHRRGQRPRREDREQGTQGGRPPAPAGRAGAARGARTLRAVARRPRCPGPGPRDRDPRAGGGPSA